VPLDPGLPAERLWLMVGDSGARMALCDRSHAAFLRERMEVMCLDECIDEGLKRGSSWRLGGGTSRFQRAYTIYTSGSTGRPKGVMNEHGGLFNRLRWMQERYPLGSQDRVLQKTSFSFDVSVWEFFWPLMVGASCIVAPPDAHRDPNELARVIDRHGVTVLHFVPAMLRAFVDTAPRSSCATLRRVFSSGEALKASVARDFLERFEHAQLSNLYGPTEATIDVSFHDVERSELDGSQPGSRGLVSIGVPAANTQLYVLDARLEPVPAAVAGELFLGGVQLARGYVSRPSWTAERFVPDPFGASGGRLYRSGDRVKRTADGGLHFLGRLDHQVKIRGYRIELGEIESLLAEHPRVSQAAVIAREVAAGDGRLVAYVVRTEEAEGEAVDLARYLGERLPDYMVPSAFVELDTMPLNPSGKVDTRALPASQDRGESTAQHVAPRTRREQALAAIWAEVLGLDRVSVRDSFFALGGHSLRAIRLLAEVNEAFGVSMPLTALFLHDTIESMAEELDRAKPEQAASEPG
jgi:nonribosomal peptide synthetase DhbF